MPGFGEILFLLSLLIVVFGAKHLPKIGGYLRAGVKSFRGGLKGEEDREIKDVTPPKEPPEAS